MRGRSLSSRAGHLRPLGGERLVAGFEQGAKESGPSRCSSSRSLPDYPEPVEGRAHNLVIPAKAGAGDDHRSISLFFALI